MQSSINGSVTTRLKGGLGNQLFQYASGKALAYQLNSSFYIDDSWFHKPNSNRKFKLIELGIDAQSQQLSKRQRFTRRIGSRALPKRLQGDALYLTEPADFGYQAFDCSPSQHIYMDGYWQSPKYFQVIRQRLIEEINLSLIERDAAAEQFPSDNTVAVHIRRGDYITQSSSQALSTKYVKAAMADFGNNFDYMFFSDDIDWCKETFTGSNISFSNNRSDLEDLKQMSEAAHNIIANSTFSWWSAWLNKNKAQRVIAPHPWTNDNTHRDILPENWETIAF